MGRAGVGIKVIWRGYPFVRAGLFLKTRRNSLPLPFPGRNPLFQRVCTTAYLPRSTAFLVEALKEPDEWEDEKDDREQFEPFIREHAGDAVRGADVDFRGVGCE